jgi:RNA polymerase sigma-70 factor (ECF subfamily)
MDAKEFRILHDRLRPRLLSAMTAVAGNRDIGEDLTATAFASAFRARDSFRYESAFYTWIYHIAINETRQRSSRRTFVPLETIGEPRELAEPDLLIQIQEREECCVRLRKILHQIPTIYRRVLVDHFVRGHSIKKVARHHGIPLGTVLSRIFYGKRRLREAWKRFNPNLTALI